ncbi:hypothetical protein [Microbacterium sp. H1-D42]|uniref:hypothetical protein n=1 Tax=Microbacterium sp. H1-D42 TaxID=2925844 RepID=UPI001F53D27D|nr:hypothetical protein [Microbacterium sp. H1-D42]UNK69561.1 hypothetical protein MNR00_10260 [Microbacterium sp. H1-D42]
MSFRTLPRTRRVTAVAASVGAVLLALTMTACAPAGGSDPELKSGDYETSLMEWRDNMDACMLKAGFDLKPGGSDSTEAIDLSQYDMAEFDAAYAECSKEVGEAPVDESLPTEDEIFESQLIFAQCMRDAGYDYPDPVKGSGGMSQAFGPETNPDDIDACDAKANEGAAN